MDEAVGRLPELQEGEVMGRKRKNNGIEPGKMVKGISKVPFTKSEWAKYQRLQDMVDGTGGYVVSMAIRDLARRKGL